MRRELHKDNTSLEQKINRQWLKLLVPVALVLPLTACSSEPTWQVIAEELRSYVACYDEDYDYEEGAATTGYGPCVRLVNVVYDSRQGENLCFSATTQVGGYRGENFLDIGDWSNTGTDLYCVSWYARYVDSDPNEPNDWRISFEGIEPRSRLPR
jgi:hypothetical protein